MQANDDNEDEDGAVEGLVDLGLGLLHYNSLHYYSFPFDDDVCAKSKI